MQALSAHRQLFPAHPSTDAAFTSFVEALCMMLQVSLCTNEKKGGQEVQEQVLGVHVHVQEVQV